jgi:hypothetical protein
LRAACPLLAQSRHHDGVNRSPFLGVKRTSAADNRAQSLVDNLRSSGSQARSPLIGGNPSTLAGFILRAARRQVSVFAMRFTGNFFSEGAYVPGGRSRRSSHTLLVPLVACAIGATASGAVILSLVGSPTIQQSVSSSSPRAIVRAAGSTSEPTETAKNRPMVETPLPEAVTTKVSSRDEPVTQTEAEHQAEVSDQQSRKHGRQRSREPHWQGRFARAFWSSSRFSSRRDELNSGVR